MTDFGALLRALTDADVEFMSGMIPRKKSTSSAPARRRVAHTLDLPAPSLRTLSHFSSSICGCMQARNRSCLVRNRLKIDPSATPARCATSAVVAEMPLLRKTARAASRITCSLMVEGRATAPDLLISEHSLNNI